MATLREIKRRIVSVKSTQKITKAMKMVSAAKLKKAQNNVLNARPFAKNMKSLLEHLVSRVDRSIHPILAEKAEVKKVLFVVVAADRGMCGSFNSNLLKKAVETINTTFSDYYKNNDLEIMCIGRKSNDYFSKRSYNVTDKYINIFGKLDFSIAKEIVENVKSRFLSGKVDKVVFIYNEFKSIGRTNLKIEQLFPIPQEEIESGTGGMKSFIDYIYEPDSHKILDKLLPRHISTQVWRILLESFASEQGARMAAMDKATENAGEMIRSLNLSYNKARQSAITKELLEIVSGAEALKENG